MKQHTRDICRRLNHHFLLPLHNPHLELRASQETWEIHFQQRRYVFPREDVVELPIDNSTTERLAEYICGELCQSLSTYDLSNLHSITVGVEEAPTQMGYYQRSLKGSE